MIGLDFITNNFDRFPVVWNNNGNPGNVMFYGNMEEDGVAEEVANRIVAIDNMTSCISRSKFKADTMPMPIKHQILEALFKTPLLMMHLTSKNFWKTGSLTVDGLVSYRYR